MAGRREKVSVPAKPRPRPYDPGREAAKVWISVLLNSTAMMAVLPHIPRYLEARFGLSGAAWAGATGVVFAAAPFAAALAGPIWGALGDRFSRKFNLARAQIAILGFFLLFPLAAAVWQLVALRFLQGLFAGYVAPAFSLAAAAWPEERRGLLLGRLQTALTLGLLAGPSLGAEVLVQSGRRAPFAVGAALVGAALLVTLFVREDRTTLKDGRAGSPKGGLLDGFRLLRAETTLALFLLAMISARMGLSLVEPQLAVFVREELGPLGGGAGGDGGIDRTIGLLNTILGVGILVCAPLYGRLGDRYRPVRVLTGAGFIMAVALAAMAGVRTSLGLFACRALYAAGFAGLLPLSYGAISLLTPQSSIAAAYALNQSSIQLALAFGFAAGGFLKSALGMRPLLLVAAALALAGFACLPLVRRRHLRRRAQA